MIPLTPIKKLSATLVCVLSLSSIACGGGGGGKLGIAECDDYLAKMDKCADKVGGATAEQLHKMKDMMSKAWAEEAKDENMKKEMPKTCTDAIADAKKQVPACDW